MVDQSLQYVRQVNSTNIDVESVVSEEFCPEVTLFTYRVVRCYLRIANGNPDTPAKKAIETPHLTDAFQRLTAENVEVDADKQAL